VLDLSKLSATIDGIAGEAGGNVAVGVHHFPSGASMGRETERVFPSASVIKVPILAALFEQVEIGRLDWESRIPLTAEACVEGSGVLRELQPGIALTVRDLARLMIIVSDNTASNLLIEAVGIEHVNALLASYGYRHTRLGRKFYDFAARDAGHENFCAAGELCDLLCRLIRGEVVSQEASAEMLAIMKRQAYSHRIPALLPPDTPIAHKTGTITGVAHDTGVIFAPSGPIALAVLTQGCRDPIAAESAIRRIARAVYDAFNA
jgi:beta-lactamase class A